MTVEFDKDHLDKLSNHDYIAYLSLHMNGGNAIAAEILAEVYMKGLYCKKDFDRAIQCYECGVNLGSKSSAFQLGGIYEEIYDQGDKSKREKIIYWYERAFNMGQCDATYMLGSIYENSDVKEVDNEKAVHWYLLGCEKGSKESIKALAALYLELGQPKKSFELLRKYYFNDIELNNLILHLHFKYGFENDEMMTKVKSSVMDDAKVLFEKKTVWIGVALAAFLVITIILLFLYLIF